MCGQSVPARRDQDAQGLPDPSLENLPRSQMDVNCDLVRDLGERHLNPVTLSVPLGGL